MYTFVQLHVRSTASLLYFIFFLLPPHVLFDHVRFNVEFKFIVFVDGAPLLQPSLFCVVKTTRQHHNSHHHKRHTNTTKYPKKQQHISTTKDPKTTTHQYNHPKTFNTQQHRPHRFNAPRSSEVVVCSLIFNSKSRTAVDWCWSNSRVNMFGSPCLPFSQSSGWRPNLFK